MYSPPASLSSGGWSRQLKSPPHITVVSGSVSRSEWCSVSHRARKKSTRGAGSFGAYRFTKRNGFSSQRARTATNLSFLIALDGSGTMGLVGLNRMAVPRAEVGPLPKKEGPFHSLAANSVLPVISLVSCRKVTWAFEALMLYRTSESLVVSFRPLTFMDTILRY